MWEGTSAQGSSPQDKSASNDGSENRDVLHNNREESAFNNVSVNAPNSSTNDVLINIENTMNLINAEKEDNAQPTFHGTTDDSINSTEHSDPDSSIKDDSELSADDARLRNKSDSSKLNEDEFPSTVSLLKTNNGAKIYLVGTAHFSEESQDDVSKVIRQVRPHVVMVELCSQRVNILQLDEKTILDEAKNINFEKIRSIVEQNGLFNGIMYVLLLNISARITKQLGIAPGGEFRRALQEAKNIPKCNIHLGDRPIQVTMHRALSALSWWQTIKLIWRLLTSDDSISKEDVERCKQRGLLREMLADMEDEFPALKRVFVQERDIFLTHSLQIAACHQVPDGPIRIVGVVGIGHVQGILDNFGHVSPRAIPPIMRIPPTSKTSRVIKATVKIAFISLIVYGGFKLVPKKWLPL